MILVTEGNVQYFIYGSMLQNAQRQNTITQYPTVEGTAFSDHFHREPDGITFQMRASEASKVFIYQVTTDADGVRFKADLSFDEVRALVERWFKQCPHLQVTTIRFHFANMVLQQYSWSDRELAVFEPTLTFKEARVQTLRVGTIVNPDQYYQAAFGSMIAVGGSTAVESQANIGSALMAGASGAAVGAVVGSFIPGIGTVAGAIIGGGIGFLGSLFNW